MAEQKKINYIPIWEKGGQENFTLPSSEFDEDSIAGQIRFNSITNTISWHTEEEEVNVLDITLDRFSSPIENISLNNNKIIELAEPENEDEATNKGYVDTLISGLETLITNLDTLVNNLKWNELEPPNGSVNLNSQKITNLATPTDSTDGATKGYIDGINTTLSNLITGLRSLNNLTSPTSINQDLIPNGNKNFGNSSNLWTIYTNGITNSTLTSPFLFDFTRTDSYPFLRNRRSDIQRGFSLATSGTGLQVFVCQDMLVTKQPVSEYGNIGIYNNLTDVNIFGFNNNNNFCFLQKTVFNPPTLDSFNTTAQVHFITKDNNNMDSYFLVQSSSMVGHRGGILFSNTQSNLSGNTSYKISSSSGNSLNATFRLTLVENNNPDTALNTILKIFGTTGQKINFGDPNNKGQLRFYVPDSLDLNDFGVGTITVGNCTTPPNAQGRDVVTEYVENNKKKMFLKNGFYVTL